MAHLFGENLWKLLTVFSNIVEFFRNINITHQIKKKGIERLSQDFRLSIHYSDTVFRNYLTAIAWYGDVRFYWTITFPSIYRLLPTIVNDKARLMAINEKLVAIHVWKEENGLTIWLINDVEFVVFLMYSSWIVVTPIGSDMRSALKKNIY